MKLVQLAYTHSAGYIDEYLSNVVCKPENIEKAVRELLELDKKAIWDMESVENIEIKDRDIIINYIDMYGDPEYTVWSYHDVKLLGGRL